jgi:phage-related holin
MVGWIMDKLISSSLAYIGIKLGVNVFAITIACWLCFNETISIVENMEDAGDSIPPFLMPLLRQIKKQINEAGKKSGESEGNDEEN